MKYVPKQGGENVNVSKNSPLVEMAWLLVGAAAGLMLMYFVLGLAVDTVVDRMPDEWEIYLAGKVDFSIETDPHDPYLKRVKKVFKKLQRQMDNKPYDFEVAIAPGNDVNAFALPGGRIVLMRALVAGVESENELAMILAHELGHFAHRDHLRGLGRGLTMAAIALLLFGNDSGITGLFTGSLNVVNASFSRRQETAADRYALDLLNKTYGHVGGATDFFARLEDNQLRWANWLNSHPASGERVLDLRDYAVRQRYRSEALIPWPKD